VSKPYRTTLNFNTNRPDKATALEWLLHLRKMHPELSISDIVSRLLIDNRSRTLEVHGTTEVIIPTETGMFRKVEFMSNMATILPKTQKRSNLSIASSVWVERFELHF